MKNPWESIIAANMESVEVPGREVPLYRPRLGGYVWVILGNGEGPSPPPNMERQDLATRGGREVTLDTADANFLLLSKTIGMVEYRHCIPWDAIADLIFVKTEV